MLGDDIFYHHIALGCRCRKHEGTGLDLIGDDGILRLMELWHTLDTDHIGACALDVGAHGVQKVRQINNVWLFGGIDDNRLALGLDSRHHDVCRGAYRHNVHIDLRTF